MRNNGDIYEGNGISGSIQYSQLKFAKGGDYKNEWKYDKMSGKGFIMIQMMTSMNMNDYGINKSNKDV